MEGTTTKREACSALASFYDPLGLLIEYDLKGRLIWRHICNDYHSWSTVININLVNEIRDWINDCLLATTIGIPRHIDVQHQPLLVCTDASTDLWGVDIRCFSGTTISPRLLSRGGVFPKVQSKWTIPRKELVALCKGLRMLKTMSPYLPIPTHYRKGQAPLDPLSPVLLPRQVRLLCDSEITIYRLRRPGNDKRLPAAERRRLSEARKLCKELDVIVLHIPSELNYADSISRGKATTVTIEPDEVLNSMTVAKVIYDYRCQPEDTDEEDVSTSLSTPPCVISLNTDGLDLPDADPLPTDHRIAIRATKVLLEVDYTDYRLTTCWL